MHVSRDNKLLCKNITSILASSGLGKHEIADDYTDWQKSQKGDVEHYHSHDLVSPFMVLTLIIGTSPMNLTGLYVHLLTEYHKISEHKVQRR